MGTSVTARGDTLAKIVVSARVRANGCGSLGSTFSGRYADGFAMGVDVGAEEPDVGAAPAVVRASQHVAAAPIEKQRVVLENGGPLVLGGERGNVREIAIEIYHRR